MEDTLPEVEDVLVLFPAQHKAVVRRRDLFSQIGVNLRVIEWCESNANPLWRRANDSNESDLS